jgi:transposase
MKHVILGRFCHFLAQFCRFLGPQSHKLLHLLQADGGLLLRNLQRLQNFSVCHTFRSAEQLAAYLVLVPMERRSGISVLERARLSKAGLARVHAALYMDMVAVVAARL